MKPLLEVCCGDIESVLAANAGGAGRIELCSALADGGVTPSAGLIRQAVRLSTIPVNVLIRPRGGDFLYNEAEVDVMVEDIILCRESGAHGVVIGALTPDGDPDLPALRRMTDAAGEMSVTFHRAFDLCRSAAEALEQLVELGCDRVLTSGQQASAIEGAPLLRKLREQAAGRILILAGAGVNPASAAELIATGAADEVHASAREGVESAMRWRRAGVPMGAPGTDEYIRKVTTPGQVNKIVQAITPYQ